MIVKSANSFYFRDLHNEIKELADAEGKIEEYNKDIAKHLTKTDDIFHASRNEIKPDYLKHIAKGSGIGALILGGLGAALALSANGNKSELLKDVLLAGGIGAAAGGLIGLPIGAAGAIDSRDTNVKSNLILHNPAFAKSNGKLVELHSKVAPLRLKLEAYHQKVQEKQDLIDKLNDMQEQLDLLQRSPFSHEENS